MHRKFSMCEDNLKDTYCYKYKKIAHANVLDYKDVHVKFMNIK